MRRVFIVGFVVAVIGGWAVVPAFACQAEPAVCAPANQDNGQSGDHAPDPTIKSHPSANDNGVDNSPSLIYSGAPKGSYCSPY
jgi:hypothetical protein